MKGASLLVISVAAALPAPWLAGDVYEPARERMVREQLEERGIEDPAVLAAMRSVPRHRFTGERHRRLAYADRPLPIGYGQTISQPYIVAFMTEIVAPKRDFRVLEIGAGSGYQAAVLAEIAAEVYTLEIIPELAASAAETLQATGYDNVTTRHADGYYGWEEHAPFDAIVVTAAAEHIPPPLIRQLREGGRMVIPVGSPMMTQQLMLVEKRADGEIATRTLMPVQFVPFRRSE